MDVSYITYIASWRASVPWLDGRSPTAFQFARLSARIEPGVKSIGPASMRVYGIVTSCGGVEPCSLNLSYSRPRTAS